MKKRSISLVLAAMLGLSMTACGGQSNESGSSGVSGSAGNNGSTIELLDLGENFNEAYYPDTDSIADLEGGIDVVILFDGTQDGWKAVAEEYMRLHGGSVVVNLNTNYTASTYGDKVMAEVKDPNTKWDIVQGNLVGTMVSQYCLNMASSVYGKNAYAGKNVLWKDVLETDAYITDKTGANTDCYILNSESLNTAWFVNTVAVQDAQVEANKDGVTLSETPTTWQELMDLCKYMQEAGYKNPLGISLDTESISSEQFTWLLRVYGDLYYRSMYDVIMPQEGDENYVKEYKVDMTDEAPESAMDFGYVYSRLFNTILDDTSSVYAGAKSARFADFIEQFYKMKDYLMIDAADRSLVDIRNAFQSQQNGKDSPQILLDYAGKGLAFSGAENDSFKLDFFDYPMMESKYIPEGSLIRDVGGNGGYLSIIQHGSAQNKLNLDFLKFFLSPYGQTIYYNTLSEKNVSIKGLTTVKNDLVVVPDAWKTYFQSTKVTFTGLADSNHYINFLIRYMNPNQDNISTSVSLWKKYLTGTGNDGISTKSFGSTWHDALMGAFNKLAEQQGWSKVFYKYPGESVTFTGA